MAENDLPNGEPAGIENWQLKDDADLERCDLTHIPFVTIDGASTKDMDDALYAKTLITVTLSLTIAIADLPPTSPQMMRWIKWRERGFTIYYRSQYPDVARSARFGDDLCSD